MKKYKLLKDWDGCKAGTVGVEQENGNIGFTKTYKNARITFSSNAISDAIADGLIEEIEEVRFKEFKHKNMLKNICLKTMVGYVIFGGN